MRRVIARLIRPVLALLVPLAVLAALLLPASAVTIAGATPLALAAATDGPPPGTPVASTFLGDPTVAAVFRDGLSAGHECTASVVRSASRSVLIGAAHCFSGTAAGVQVVPGYHDGVAPYGVWTVTRAYVDPGWIADQDPQRDWVFLVVAPQRWHGRTARIQDVVGGNLPLFALRDGQRVTVPAYGAGIDDRPITCTVPSYRFQGFPAFDCDGYIGGTSGSPWLVRTPLGPAVTGVIGGLHQGGCVTWTSYSSVLGNAAWRGYLRASLGARPDVLPDPGSDGC